ncbi:cell number regulator 8-like [Canna indica]|uniref:Cell number regulator 8-like n=1 Tax=Canna indica TaxID=4628 RepID=A0AAQ3KQH3_9LILI|nr:cell number regulator 8-like [Canna indica]
MANVEESNPLLKHPDGCMDRTPADEENAKDALPSPVPEPQKKASPPPAAKGPSGWTADGLPVGHGSVVGEPIARVQWNSGLFTCLGRNDEFCSSDLEVCLLGSFAPCVLYGSNAEWLGAVPGSFADNCLPYAGLYLLGNALFGWNCLAPWFSHPSRTALRHKFNLEGSFEAFSRSCGCCRGAVEDELKREQLEQVCDFATHYVCHPCSLCQEGRELRRRLPHPGFSAQPVFVMMPPMEQTMGRGV